MKSRLARMRMYEYSDIFFNFKFFLLVFCFFLLLLSLLRPAWGFKELNIEAHGTDIVFSLDVSKSMKALDLSRNGQNIDRLSMAKAMIADFVTNNPQNRYGLVIFAGEAFVSTPLTIDYKAFLTFLDGVDYNDVAIQGTDIGKALKASIDRFYSDQDKERGRAIVLISDGGEEMSQDVKDFARVAKELNIKIFTIGIGSTKAVPIPDSVDVFGHVNYKRYHEQIVKTKLNEKPLKEIAVQTDGKYFHTKEKNDLEKINSNLKNIQSSILLIKQQSGREDKYQYFLFISFLFFLFTIIDLTKLFNIKNKKKILKIISKYKYKIPLFIFLLFSLSGCSSDLNFRYLNTKGNENYKKQFFTEAENKYKQATNATNNKKYISNNNLATLKYKLSKYDQALKIFEKNIKKYCEKIPNEHCALMSYNLGNTYYRLGENEEAEKQKELWNQAIMSFKKTLELTSDDLQAQENIDFILNKLEEESFKNKQAEDNKNKNDQNSEQEKNGDSNIDKEKQAQDSENLNENNNKDKTGDVSASEQGNKEKTDDTQVEQGQKEKDDSLDNVTSKQVDEYLKQLEEQEKNNQDYFRQNPNAQNNNSDPFQDFFNDPFFNSFFGGSVGNNFDNNLNNNEVDW